MNKDFRIKKSTEIEAIMKNQKNFGTKELRVFIKENDETSHFRYAISVGKKLGKAVIRNKYKRRLRAIMQNNKEIIASCDIFIVAKPDLLKIDFKTTEKQFLYILRKMNKIKEKK